MMNKNILLKFKRETIALLSKIRLRKFSTNYLGKKFDIPVVYGIVNGGYVVPAEFWMGDCLRAFVTTKGGCVIDVGVNVGLYLVKLKCISEDIEYIGFEPNPSCNLYTQELIRLNRFENTRVFPLALSDTAGVSRFYASEIGDKTGSLIEAHKVNEAMEYAMDVYTTSGDDVIDLLGLKEISVIKVDVEEAEVYVLKGLDGTIRKYRPYLYCEILFANDDADRIDRIRSIYRQITNCEYVILGIKNDTKELYVVDSVDELGVMFGQEYVFCPVEIMGEFLDAISVNSSNIKFVS